MVDALKIVINAESMTWDDMRLLMSMQSKGNATTPEDLMNLVDLFDRFVEGGAAAVPIVRTNEAITGLIEAIGGLINSKNLPSASQTTSGQVKKRRRSTSS